MNEKDFTGKNITRNVVACRDENVFSINFSNQSAIFRIVHLFISFITEISISLSKERYFAILIVCLCKTL